jgi:hypothetical protein
MMIRAFADTILQAWEDVGDFFVEKKLRNARQRGSLKSKTGTIRLLVNDPVSLPGLTTCLAKR